MLLEVILLAMVKILINMARGMQRNEMNIKNCDHARHSWAAEHFLRIFDHARHHILQIMHFNVAIYNLLLRIEGKKFKQNFKILPPTFQFLLHFYYQIFFKFGLFRQKDLLKDRDLFASILFLFSINHVDQSPKNKRIFITLSIRSDLIDRIFDLFRSLL